MKNKKEIAVIGAGSWGTAIAGCLSNKGYRTYIWGHRSEHIIDLINDRENKKYLPGFLFNNNLKPTYDIKEAVTDSETVCMVVPSHGFRKIFSEISIYLKENCRVVSAVKGIENITLMTMTQVMSDVLKGDQDSKEISLSVLSGPTFAREVADGLPAALTIGNKNIEIARDLQKIFSTEKIRVYTSTDVIGMEVSSALKNIVAIATGISDGIGYGLNARAAIITRGLAEIRRLGLKMGARKRTFSGLSGIGDLVLTCTGDLSRNRSVGLKLGKGLKLEKILKEMNMVAEGVKTTESAYNLAKIHTVEMPILEQVYKILYENKDCATAVKDLLKRKLKDE
jgi:glycerol-3-phosphate dehydrogenase (NAD(P)+)